MCAFITLTRAPAFLVPDKFEYQLAFDDYRVVYSGVADGFLLQHVVFSCFHVVMYLDIKYFIMILQ